MNHIIKNFYQVKSSLKAIKNAVNITIISKNQSKTDVEILLKENHRIFGENRVIEAIEKWNELKNIYSDVELRFVGKLQSNKIKKALQIFDVIETVDNYKLARLLSIQMKKMNKWPICYVQINVGNESNKNGIDLDKVDHFIEYIINQLNIPVKGLMCIPPNDNDPDKYFSILKIVAKKHNLPYLSMGMSDDYISAIKYGATHIRLGRAIFG